MSTRTGSSASGPTPDASRELPLLSSSGESWQQLSDASYHGFNTQPQSLPLSVYRGGEATSPVGSGGYSQHFDSFHQYIHSPDSISPTMSSSSAFSVAPGTTSAGTSPDYLTGPLSSGASETNSSDLDEIFTYCAVENQHSQMHREYTDNTTRLTFGFPQLGYVDTSVAQYRTDEPMSPSTGSSSAAHYPLGIMPASPQGSVSPTHQNVFGGGSSPFKRSDSAVPQVQNPLHGFKAIPAQAVAVTIFGPFIPQKQYRPHTTADKKRYVEQIRLEDPIIFECESPYEWGIPLKDALRSNVKRMCNRDDTVFQQRGPSVSIRIEWPGYGSWSRQIPTKDFKSPPGPITRQKLAKNVAKNVERFLKYAQDQIMDEDADPKWRVSPNHIKFDDLVLVSLHHVSMGSWQPHLRLRTPFAAVGR